VGLVLRQFYFNLLKETIMPKFISTAVILFLPVCGVIGDDSPGSALATAYTNTASIMATIKDEGSLKAARTKVLKAAEQIKDAMIATYKPDGSSTMTAAQKKELTVAEGKFTSELKRVTAIPGGADFGFEVIRAMKPTTK
jgi:hypothetical protein